MNTSITDFTISSKERTYLKSLAEKQQQISNLPVMKERTEHWYDHNDLKSDKPVVVLETKYCLNDLIDLECTSEFGRAMEMNMLRHQKTYELVNDDTVVPGFFEINWDINIKELGFEDAAKRAEDDDGNSIGYETVHYLENLQESFFTIKETGRTLNRENSLRCREAAEEIVGEFLPVVFRNQPQLNWYASPAKKIVHLMGTAGMMMAPYDSPEEYQKLWNLLTDSAIQTYEWLAENEILYLNNGNNYAGSGTYGFTRELPTEDYRKTGKIGMKDLWVNLNAQESVGISPDMYGEYYFPSYMKLAEKFGRVYYGCCEPMDDLWDDYICKLPNLRKVSVSPWANLELMGEKLRGTDVIYSRKPSPNLLAIKDAFIEDEFRKHIEEGVTAARGCHNEIVIRDIYALYGDRKKLGRAVEIIRESVDKLWKP